MAFKIDFLVIAMVQSLGLALGTATDHIVPPRLPIEHLRSALSSDDSTINLHRLLHDSKGILRIAVGGGDDDASNADLLDLRKRALGHLCDCPTFRSSMSPSNGAITFEDALNSHPKDLQQIDLPDGAVRRTLASATIGFDGSNAGKGIEHANALELPSWVKDTCGQDAYNSFEDLRDVVADVVDIFVERLDQEKSSSTDGVSTDSSYRELLSDANHLEHFHVYTKSGNAGGNIKDEKMLEKYGGEQINDDESNGRVRPESEVSTFDYHTDAGFFLSFVPAMNCHSSNTDNSSFFLKGQKEPVTFQDDEVVIMLGAGAQYWLPSPEEQENSVEQFLAASHALRLLPGTHRTWYGKMHLLHSSLTPSITATVNQISLPPPGTLKLNLRQLQHAKSPAACNNQTNFFCWMQCLDIPSSDQADQKAQDGYSLYCLDPAKLASSGNSSIVDATEVCEGGFVHNSACKGRWLETDGSIASYELTDGVEENNGDGTGDQGDSDEEDEQGDTNQSVEHEHAGSEDKGAVPNGISSASIMTKMGGIWLVLLAFSSFTGA